MEIEQGNPAIGRGYCIVFEAKPVLAQEQKAHRDGEPRVLVLSFCIGEKLIRRSRGLTAVC